MVATDGWGRKVECFIEIVYKHDFENSKLWKVWSQDLCPIVVSLALIPFEVDAVKTNKKVCNVLDKTLFANTYCNRESFSRYFP